jgi:CheY-like chemotaxis protein
MSLLLGFESDFHVIGFATNGREAIDIVQTLKPQVTLMDINMPVMDGLTATRNITRLGLDTKIIMCSVQDDEDYIRRAARVGAVDYHTLPPNVDELYNSIRRSVNPTSANEPAPIFAKFKKMEEPEANVIIEKLKSEQVEVRRQAVRELTEVALDRSLLQSLLLQALKDDDIIVRGDAALSIGQVADKSVIPTLTRLLDDDEPYIRSGALLGLAGIGDSAVIETIVLQLQDRSDVHNWENQSILGRVCDFAVLALEEIGTPEALAAVNQWRRSQSSSPRNDAQ